MVDPLGVLTSLKKSQLVKKGYCCGKTRRRPVDSQLLRVLESKGQVKTLIFLSFLIGLAALIFYGSGPQQGETGSQQAKQFLFALLVFFTALAQLWINHPQTFERNSRVVLMFGTILVHLLIVKVLLVCIHNGSISHEIGALIFPLRAGAAGDFRVVGQEPGDLRGHLCQPVGIDPLDAGGRDPAGHEPDQRVRGGVRDLARAPARPIHPGGRLRGRGDLAAGAEVLG